MNKQVIVLPRAAECARCKRASTLHLGLCEKGCYSMYNRLRRTKYGGSEALTVDAYVQLHPLQHHRRVNNQQIHSTVSQLVSGYIISGSATREIANQVRTVALSNIPVIIDGETGVGKEGLAQALHYFSSRRKKSLIPVNCAAVSEELAESEFFGHERGSFTGAHQKTMGFFEEAHEGTIFLDEIEAMPRRIQGKLLRVLDCGEVRSVGSSKTKKVNVRVVVATNQNLKEMCAKKEFRDDLYHRLGGIVIKVPPLRERVDEVGPLAQYLVKQITDRQLAIDHRVMHAFEQYAWPGNIRELRHVLARACLFARGNVIELQHLPSEIYKNTGKHLASVR